VDVVGKMGAAVLASGQSANDAEIEFSTAGEDWPEVTHAALMDASTGGNMLYFGPAVTSRTIPSGDTFKILIGQFTIEEQ
jgi:hypothetical protein